DVDPNYVSLFKVNGDKKYRVTDYIFRASRRQYTGLDYSIKPTGTTYTYKRPNTISTDVTAEMIAEGENLFDRIPYAAVRAKFSVAGSKSMEAKEPVYAIKGVYIGGIRDLKEKYNKDNAETFTISTDGLSTDEASIVKEVVDAVKQYLKNGWTEVAADAEEDDIAEAIEADGDRLKNYYKADEYPYRGTTAIDIQRGLAGYYTYYAQYITHDNSASAVPQDKYGVSRNYVYQIGVNKFTFLGNNGTGLVGDGPKEADLSDLFLEMTVKVADWLVNPYNSAWNF
ncbi:MAG: fimbria major subunit, partial [Muribaculaceae bacterium]|nr:fimbria major subunit [Muribaculaceae bacterium]